MIPSPINAGDEDETSVDSKQKTEKEMMAFNDIEISMGMNKNTPYTHAKSPKSRSSRIDIMDATKLAKIDFDNGRDHSGNGQTRPI